MFQEKFERFFLNGAFRVQTAVFGIVSLVDMPFKEFENGNEKLRNVVKEKGVVRKSPTNGIPKYIGNGRERLVLNALF